MKLSSNIPKPISNTAMQMKLFFSLAALCLWASPTLLGQDWTLVEDFSSLDDWSVMNDNTACAGEDPEGCFRIQEVVTDPATGSGTVGLFRAAPLNMTTNWAAVALRPIDPPVLPEYNGVFTVYFEFAIEDFRQDTVFGTHAGDPTTLLPGTGYVKYGNFSTALRVTTAQGGLLEVRDEEVADYVVISNEALATDTWYKVWLVHKNDNDFSNPEALTFDLYIEGGEWAAQTLVYSGAWYRSTEGAVRNFSVIQTTGDPSATVFGNSGLLLRKLYVDYGGSQGGADAENLSEPGEVVETWGGYTVVIGEDGKKWVDTGSWLGWVNVESAPYVFMLDLGTWAYMAEPAGTASGAWTYLFKGP